MFEVVHQKYQMKEKLNARTISAYFIGYSEKSKGHRFYYPNYSTKIVESSNARFIENGQVCGTLKLLKVNFKETLLKLLQSVLLLLLSLLLYHG